MARRWHTHTADFADNFADFINTARGTEDSVGDSVSAIIDAVRTRGGSAVAEYTAKFDQLVLDPVLLSSDNVDLPRLAHACPDDLKQAIDFAAERIGDYHKRQPFEDHRYTDDAGLELGWRWTAIDRVGVYVPGGLASYPSSVLMNVVPAKIAGVQEVAMVAPAPKGQLAPAVAYAALRAGVDEYYPIGGAQAVAALAYGAGHLKPVDKIVGPGNAYVAEAKRQVFGKVGIDTIAGPSEILILADASANPAWVAADLLSQSEHDVSSQSILLTTDAELADSVAAEVDAQLKTLHTEVRARQAWETHGAIIVTRSLDEACMLANQIAAEHVELAVSDPDALLPKIRHAGAVFLGHHIPEALGDYVTGSNHVLPTSRAARFSSGLSVYDFVKRMSVQSANPAGFAALAPAALKLAEAEGLPAHARSITIRSNTV